MKLQVFDSTYFEASKKINICLIVKVLLLRRVKLLNNNVIKEKKHVRKFDIRIHKNCRR